MRAKLGFALLAVALAAVAIVPTAEADWDKWAWVCHNRGNGDVVLLAVGARAVATHQEHGDVAYPYDPFVQPACPAE